jgi:hypothetical protein
VLRFDVAVIVIAVASGVMWVEHGHRVVIDAPMADAAASVAAACSDTDAVPYSAGCIAFMKGATETGMRWRTTAEPPSIPAPQ